MKHTRVGGHFNRQAALAFEPFHAPAITLRVRKLHMRVRAILTTVKTHIDVFDSFVGGLVVETVTTVMPQPTCVPCQTRRRSKPSRGSEAFCHWLLEAISRDCRVLGHRHRLRLKAIESECRQAENRSRIHARHHKPPYFPRFSLISLFQQIANCSNYRQ